MGGTRALLIASVVGTVGLGGAGCGDNQLANDAAVTPDGVLADAALPDGNPLTPPTLAGTGLCTNAACTTFAANVLEYVPRFELWADTATKRRWIYLPPGTTIDTSDMDHWKFPVGTKLWKEFTRDGTRVETRYIVKLLPDDDELGAWFYTTYEWNAAQDATTQVDVAGVQNANGTNHDIPSRQHCRECHDELKPTRVLGFGAIQLDHTPANAALLDLEDLIAANRLSAPPGGGSAGARFPLPGTSVAREALGYLHANCGHCHNPTSGGFGHTPVDLRLRVGSLATVAGTQIYTSTVNVTGITITENNMSYSKIIDTTTTDNSTLIVRLNSTNPGRRMPFRGSELVDVAGQAALRAWIDSL
ncbi:MAG: hypothetical protein M3680_08915 [Myxococcota bacterium]|nr:hypothetical protein [Myxococcota bacterium]